MYLSEEEAFLIEKIEKSELIFIKNSEKKWNVRVFECDIPVCYIVHRFIQ